MPTPKKGESRNDFVQRCMDSAEAKRDFPDEEQRLGFCEGVYDNKGSKSNMKGMKLRTQRAPATPSASHHEMLSVLAEPAQDEIRRETWEGVEHVVVPVVMLKEKVLSAANGPGPELALAEEFGRFPEGWNGRPVVLNHPQKAGLYVSANAPDILEDRSFGKIFNTTLEGDKLKAEMWLNPTRAAELGEEFKEAVDRMENGEEITEVSTGLFSLIEEVQGVYKGEEFEGIWRNIVPDHLAVLPEGLIGACSVEEGCGAPRVNLHGASPDSGNRALQAVVLGSGAFYAEGDMACKCNKGEGEACECGASGDTDGGSRQSAGMFQTLMQRFGNLLTLKRFRDNATGLSDMDKRRALEAALIEEGSEMFFVVAVFEDAFIYEEGFDFSLYERPFEIRDDGTVVLSGSKTKVRPVTQFVPVTSDTTSEDEDEEMRSSQHREEETMQVDDIINSPSNSFSEEDREYLEGLDEAVLAKFAAAEPAGSGEGTEGTEGEGESGEAAAAPTTTPNENEEETAPELSAAAQRAAQSGDPEEFLRSMEAPAEIKSYLERGLRMQREHKKGLIDDIVACERNKFPKEKLEQMTVEDLESLHSFVDQPSYVGKGAVRTQAGAADENEVPAPPAAFEVKSA